MMFLWDVVSCNVVKVDQHFIHVYYFHEEPGSSVSILSGYGLDDRAIGVRSPAGAKDFSSNLWAHPASCMMGTGGPFPRA
jgi:hypothetical protein